MRRKLMNYIKLIAVLLPFFMVSCKKHNEPTTEPVTEAILKSNIMSKWSSSDVANKDLQEFLIYKNKFQRELNKKYNLNLVI